jgi:hypothetical protein
MDSQSLLTSLVDYRVADVTILSTTVLAVIVAFALLNRLLTPRIDPREPPVVKPSIPWVGHIIGIIRHQADYPRIIQSVSLPLPNLLLNH